MSLDKEKGVVENQERADYDLNSTTSGQIHHKGIRGYWDSFVDGFRRAPPAAVTGGS